MHHNLFKFNTLAILALLVVSCSNTETAENSNNSTSNAADNQNQGQATLNLVANGEDFVRQGFVTKDGWTMSFDPKATRSVIALRST